MAYVRFKINLIRVHPMHLEIFKSHIINKRSPSKLISVMLSEGLRGCSLQNIREQAASLMFCNQ